MRVRGPKGLGGGGILGRNQLKRTIRAVGMDVGSRLKDQTTQAAGDTRTVRNGGKTGKGGRDRVGGVVK